MSPLTRGRGLAAEAHNQLAFLESEFGFSRDDTGAVAAWTRDGERVAVTRGPLALLGGAFSIEWSGPGLPGTVYYAGTRSPNGYAEELRMLIGMLRKDFDGFPR